MKHILSLLAILTFATTLVAQRYNTAAGLRLTKGVGLTVQQRVADQWTIEGIAMTNFKDNNDLIGLAEYHGKIIFQKRLNWYVGAGLHTGSYSGSASGLKENTFGAAFVGGIEFTVGKLNFSVDYMPMVNFVGDLPTLEATPAISVRYVLIKRPRKTIRDRIGKKKKGKGKKKGGLKDIFKKKEN